MITDAIEIKAPFYDVDSCDVVWHGHYVKYFEEARCHLLDKVGYNYQVMREDGYFFPVVDMKIKFVAPLVFAQVFVVSTTLVEWQNRLKINYEIFDKESKEKITKGYTTQVAVDVKNRQMQFESPSRLIEMVEAMR
ncbi:MAG: acyl-CoA thioesterase [Acidiferrobacterales bacterium]|nr:acyl-CoA thioesterase [Acidiferrobacterales bacterium]